MKATARAHPIQGLVKYHGMRDPELRHPYHDSISVCTAPSHTTTTVAFDDSLDGDRYVVDGDPVAGRGAERVRSVIEPIREAADIHVPVRLESENTFPTNVGLGSSASGFAAAATAAAAAAGLDWSHPRISAVARRGSASAARAVAGGYADLHAGLNDHDSRAERLSAGEPLESEVRIIVGLVPTYKETEAAHAEAAESHMFSARLAHVHKQLAVARDAIREGDFERVFRTAEHDTLSLAATTMTGPSGWVYWQPESLAIFQAVRDLRADGIPAYFSVDTGATVYVNTLAEHAESVERVVAGCGVETRRWEVGGPARVLESTTALF